MSSDRYLREVERLKKQEQNASHCDNCHQDKDGVELVLRGDRLKPLCPDCLIQ